MICWRLGFRHSETCQFVKGRPASYPTRLIIKWSPMSRVFSMEPEGMTRAWPIVPLTNRKMRPTQNHASISRRMRALRGALAWGVAVFALIFVCTSFDLGILAWRSCEQLRPTQADRLP